MGNTSRISWVDTLKSLGIAAIYIGHFGNAAGKIYPFVFTYHVALFFFAAGFFANIKKEESIWQFTKKQFLRLIVPYFGFVLLITILLYLQRGENIPAMLLQGLTGIRNQVYTGSLWFLPCMFIMSVAYHLILRVVKKKIFALMVATALFTLTQTVLPFNPGSSPSWFWNIDSAMYYIIFYAIGAFVFPYIKDFSFKTQKNWMKICVSLFALICISIAGIVFFKGFTWIEPIIGTSTVWLIQIFFPLLIISANIFFAVLLRKVVFLQIIGQSTLILCGTENAIKLLIPLFIGIFSLTINVSSPLAAILYTMVCLVINRYTFVAAINRFFPLLAGKYPKIKSD